MSQLYKPNSVAHVKYRTRLRDISQDTDQDQRKRIAELEKDVISYSDMQCISLVCSAPPRTDVCFSADFESALIKLSNAEVQIDDLKIQLDDALGAEEMLVQLTERNLELGEVRRIVLQCGIILDADCRKSRRCALPSRI